MKPVYTDEFLTINYCKSTATLCGDWNNCQNTAHFDRSLNNFKYFFDDIKPKNTLLNNQKLANNLCEDLQNRANPFIIETVSNKNFNGKIAWVLNENLYAKARYIKIHQELNSNMKLRYFTEVKTAVSWLNSSLCLQDLDSKLKIEDAGVKGYDISLTVSKNELQDYVSILRHLLRNRAFCLKNIGYFNSLTCREREVLQYIIKGFKNDDIAAYLFLSVETVKTHRKRILIKLNCSNTYGLTQYLMFFEH